LPVRPKITSVLRAAGISDRAVTVMVAVLRQWIKVPMKRRKRKAPACAA